MTNFYYTKDTERGTESLVVAGQVVRTIPSSHPNFIKIRDYCFTQNDSGQDIDMEHVLKLSDVQTYINDQLLRITDRVSFKGGELLWDGEPMEGALAKHIVRMIRERDENYVAFALFLENLSQNPSEASRNALFEWIADRDFTITDDGHFIGYKGVNADYTSWHKGYGIVNGVEHQNANLDNTPGNVVEIPRGKVDANRNSTCSVGLHVGTRSYATGYGTRLVIVSVNPRDVVMVPHDAGGQKMRVCRYLVLADNDEELTTTTYNGSHRAEEEVPTLDRCDECDCLLNDGNCTCESCPLSVSLSTCSTCWGEDDTGSGTCTDCELDEEPALCGDCANELAADGTCGFCADYCEECDCSPCECEEEDDGRCTICFKPRDECTGNRRTPTPNPYGICKWDGKPLRADGKCSTYLD